MQNNSCPSLLKLTLFLLASAFLSMGSIVSYTVYAEDEGEDEYNSSTSLDQEMKQNQKCKIGVLGDPQDSVSSTVSGLCNQQGLNNVDSDSNLDGIGISMGP